MTTRASDSAAKARSSMSPSPIDITLSKAKYRQQGTVLHRQGIDPPEGTRVWMATNGGAYVSRDVSNGPIRTKKYSKRTNKIRARSRVGMGATGR